MTASVGNGGEPDVAARGTSDVIEETSQVRVQTSDIIAGTSQVREQTSDTIWPSNLAR